jgi:PilZ domain
VSKAALGRLFRFEQERPDMTTLLIWARAGLESDLSHTPFWRDDLERYVADKDDDVRMLLFATEPHVVVVDRELPGAEAFLQSLRQQTLPHPISIVVLSGDHAPSPEADAVLSLPPGPEWDDRLVQVLQVQTRKQERFVVQFAVETLLRQERRAHPGLALNMSAGGILIDSPSLRLHPGDDVRLTLPIPGIRDPVEGRARVVRQPLEERLGLRFEAFSGDGDVQVREYLARLAGRPSP